MRLKDFKKLKIKFLHKNKKMHKKKFQAFKKSHRISGNEGNGSVGCDLGSFI